MDVCSLTLIGCSNIHRKGFSEIDTWLQPPVCSVPHSLDESQRSSYDPSLGVQTFSPQSLRDMLSQLLIKENIIVNHLLLTEELSSLFSLLALKSYRLCALVLLLVN